MHKAQAILEITHTWLTRNPGILQIKVRALAHPEQADSSYLKPLEHITVPDDGLQKFNLQTGNDYTYSSLPVEIEVCYIWASPPHWLEGIQVNADKNFQIHVI